MAENPAAPSAFHSFNQGTIGRDLLSQDNTLVNTSRTNSLDGSNFGDAIPGEALGQPITTPNDSIRQSPNLDGDESSTTGAAANLTSTKPSPTHQAGLHKVKESSVGWRDLPKKDQLAVLTLARLSEPLAERSLAAYLFYQLRSFDSSLPDSTITAQGGLLTAAFAGAQFFTAIWWGRLADNPKVGRKNVILIGLTGTAVATLGVGFSQSFAQAMTWRIFAGALNGNTGVMRTMISEMIEERKFQSRAFLLLPMCFNIGVIIGPILGGFLADPIKSFPKTFGPGSVIGGADGVSWMLKFPYALPNLFSASFIFMSVLGVLFGLHETHQMLKHRKDWGLRLASSLRVKLFGHRQNYDYMPIESDETELSSMAINSSATEASTVARRAQGQVHDVEMDRTASAKLTGPVITKERTGIKAIITRNIMLTLSSHFLLALHVSSFNALVFLFLPNPPSSSRPSTFSLRFSGGVGLSSEKVGMATAILGVIGFPLQILAFPRVNNKLGTLVSYRWFLPFCAIAYTTIPFLALVYDRPAVLWPCLTLVLAAQVLGRTFALPSTTILINNSSPSPAVLGTVHGVAQSVSSAARMLGPTVGGWALGLGLRNTCVGAVWWVMAGIVGVHWSLLWMIWEGDGRGGRLEQ